MRAASRDQPGCRPVRRGFLRRWITVGSLVAAAAVLVGGRGLASAFFASTATARTASTTAATISPPTGFTATASGATSASLSWTAPTTLTGFTLSQSPGTLAGCSATPTSGTTSCTAAGLLPATTYTWTLKAVFNNWSSAPVTASAETALGAVDLGNGNATCILLSLLCTGPSVTTTSGRSELIFIYLSSTGLTGTSVTGISGPFTGASQLASVQAGAGGHFLYAWKATGSGAGPAAVTVSFSGLALLPTAWVDVVQLGTGEAPLACSSCTSSGTTTSGNQNAAVSMTVQQAANSEVAFLASASNGTFTPSAGFSVFGGGGASAFGTWGKLVVQASANFSMGATGQTWGSIGVEVQP
jgi:hypothetical protein